VGDAAGRDANILPTAVRASRTGRPHDHAPGAHRALAPTARKHGQFLRVAVTRSRLNRRLLVDERRELDPASTTELVVLVVFRAAPSANHGAEVTRQLGWKPA
jgi:hypothetical protein